MENEQDSVDQHHRKREEQLEIIKELIFIVKELIHKHHPTVRPVLAFKVFFNNINFDAMQIVKSLTLTSTAPVTLAVTVTDLVTGLEIAGTLTGLSYNVDQTQDIAVVDPADPLSVDIHAVAPQGGATVTGTGNFVSTLTKPDGVTPSGTVPAFSGSITGTLVLVNNIVVAVLSPVISFNQ